MRDSKFGLRAFGLALVAALGLMAFMAVAAQAENLEDGGKAGKFLVNKAAPTAGTTFTVTQVGTGTLLVPTRVDILCTGGTITGEFKSETEALGKATFTSCTAWSPVSTFPHVTKLPCTIPEGKVVVEKAIALSKLHNSEPYILLEEDPTAKEKEEGKTPGFTNVKFEGAECGLPKENKVTGSVVGKVINNDTTTPSVLLSKAIQELFQVGTKGDHLKFGALESYIDAEGTATGTGSNAGKTLGVC